MPFDIVETFKYKKRQCVIVRVSGFAKGHNGYVEAHHMTPKTASYQDYYGIEADEPTYMERGVNGMFMKKTFIGFDSLHLWNADNPVSKTQASVKERLKRFTDELIAIEDIKYSKQQKGGK